MCRTRSLDSRLPKAPEFNSKLRRFSAGCFLVSTIVAGLLLAGAVHARVLSIEIERRVPILADHPFSTEPKGATGGIPYELIEGRAFFGFDPKNEANAQIIDLERAPRGKSGLVEANAEFVALQPIDPKDRRGTAIFDVPNRGRRLILAGMNRTEKKYTDPATLDATSPVDWGDGFLMRRGLTILWVGWQADAPTFPGGMRLEVPHAVGKDGTPIRGFARSDWVVDADTERLEVAALRHAPHRAAEPTSDQNTLTRRRGRETAREIVPPTQWRFDEDRSALIATNGAFEAGWIYELVYLAQDPPIVGLGFAAFRDFAAYAARDPRSPFPVERTIAHGVSQSGRFLRHFLYEGFNRDEAGKRVFDGAMILIGGAGRGGFNHRFSHPGRVGNPFANFFYPGDDFPFTSRATRDASKKAGLLDRARATATMPKLFQINTGYEYWGRGASLIHMTPDGKKDVAPLENERLYHLASAPHYSLPFPPDPRSEIASGLFIGTRVDTRPHQRALLDHLVAWVERDVAPPPSAIPSIAQKTLLPPQNLEYPTPLLKKPRSPHVAYRMDYGSRWADGIVSHQPPKRGEAYAIRVPAIDAIGNEATGIRPLELRAPIGTYTPWALRHGMPGGADEMTGYIGTFVPLAIAESNEADRRPTLATLYADREAYKSRVEDEIKDLIKQGFLLKEDRASALSDALDRYDWAVARTPSSQSQAREAAHP